MHPLLSSLDTLIESVAMASQAGQFELNVMLPGMLKCMLESTDMLKNFLPIFSANMLDSLKVNSERIGENVEKNSILVTLLSQYIYWIFEGRRDIGINKFKEIDQGVSS